MNRVHQLINKLLSVKGLFVIISTIVYIRSQTDVSMYVYLISWGLFILGREVFKIISLVKGVPLYEQTKAQSQKNENVQKETSEV